MDITLKPSPTGTGITPIMPTEPPKEIKEMTFSSDPGLISSGGEGELTTDKGIKIEEVKPEVKVEPTVEKKVEDKKVVEKVADKPAEKKSILKPPTEEVKKEEKPVLKAEPVKPTIKPITPVKEKKEQEHDAFDYAGYTPQETTNLKNMSRQSRDWAASLIKETKSLSALKDATYLQHEQGYTLSPEYQQIQQKAYLAQVEGKCWETALLNIKGGKPIREIVGFNPDGSAKMGEEKTATDADEIRIQNNLSACINASNGLSGQMQQYPNRFKQQMQIDLQAVDQVQKERFAWVADPKLLDHSVAMEGQGDKKLRDIKQEFKNMLPVYWQNSPVADVASNLFVAMIIQGAELAEARNGQQIAEIKKEEVSRGEPTSDNTLIEKKPEINGKPIPSMFSLEGMPTR